MSDTSITLDTAAARKAMIDSQLRTSGVNEEFVLARMLAVGREEFLPAEKKPLAYIDRSIAFETGGHLGSPLFYGKLLMEAVPERDDRVLIVEGGTGYLAELVRPLVASLDVVGAQAAAKGEDIDAEAYSMILVDGAIEDVPVGLTDGLAPEGRIVGGLLLRGVTRLASGRKIAGETSIQAVEDLGIPVLKAFNQEKAWTFS